MTQLKELLIEKIVASTDELLLEEIARLLETGKDEEVYQLNDEQKAAIAESKRQIRNGQFLTNEQANKQAREWLEKQ